MMKLLQRILLAVAILPSIAANLSADQTVPSSEVGKSVRIIGRLGKELGTVVTVLAVSAAKEQPQADKGILVLQIVQVNGESLEETVTIALQFPSDAKLPDTKGNAFVVKYRGYETGSFVGLPADARTGDENPKPLDWHFHTSFKVLLK